MFDFSLHFRFLQKASEAFFEMGQASVAATLAWQSRVHDELTSPTHPAPTGFAGWPAAFGDWTPLAASPFQFFGSPAAASPATPNAFAPWQMWMQTWAPAPPPVAASYLDPMQTWSAMASAWQTFALSGGASAFGAGSPGFSGVATGWPAFAAQSIWNATPRCFYQGPITAMMLSYGVPYAVAAPTARASTSAMDAADAACAQWRLVFGNDNTRPQTGWNEATPQLWPAYRL